MENKSIPSAGASITEKEIELVTEAIKYGWYENRNMHIEPFVKEFSKYAKAKYCLPVTNCTSAIHLALAGLNIGKGDEVIVPDITWVASVAPIHYVGATPIFADIDENNWCLSPASFEKSITQKTKAVIMVDLYGNMPNVDAILDIAKNHNILIIEDAAEAIGAKYKNQNAGTFGDVNVFSFNATKLLVSGQGGMLTTNNKKVFERAKLLAHHGMVKYTDKTTFWSTEIGFNYQWTNIQAALAFAQLSRLEELVAQRRRIFNWYYERLKDIDGIRLNNESKDVFNTYWVVTAIVDKKYNLTKEDFLRKFQEKNIDCRPFFYPISSMPAYKDYVGDKNMKTINPVSYKISPYGISFPSAAILKEEDVDLVCNMFQEFLNLR
jgi:perosamine synthetase